MVTPSNFSKNRSDLPSPDATYTSFAYDGVGNKTSSQDVNGSYSYTYDKTNRLLSATDWNNKTTTYSYTANGNRYQMTDPEGGVTSYSYDKTGRLAKLQNPLDEVTTYTYNALGLPTRVDNHNGAYTTYVYDSANRLTSLANSKSDSSVISSFSYLYNKANNRTKATLSAGDYIDYAYDKTYQLTSETKKDSGDTTLYFNVFSYDKVGNRKTLVHYDNSYTTYTYSHNTLNQLTSSNDGSTTTTYSYDSNGNLTQKAAGGNTTNYTWNYEDKLATATLPDSSVTTFAYSPDGLRIKKIDSSGTTKYVLDGLAVLKEYSAADTVIASYTPGVSVSKDGASYFYHYDALGSTTETTDASQNISTTYTYDAFGNLLSSGGSLSQPYQYVGQQYYYTENGLGLQLLGLRWYDPETGRFVSRDPLLSVNPYVYAGNNSGNKVDPSGLKTEAECVADNLQCLTEARSIVSRCYINTIPYMTPGILLCLVGCALTGPFYRKCVGLCLSGVDLPLYLPIIQTCRDIGRDLSAACEASYQHCKCHATSN